MMRLCCAENILLIGPLPPPIAGPEIVTQSLAEAELLNGNFKVIVLNTTLKKSNIDKGKVDAKTVLKLTHFFYRLAVALLFKRPVFVFYLPTSATKAGWVRDGMTLSLCRMFGVRHGLLFQGAHFGFFFNQLTGFQLKCLRSLVHKALPFVQSESLKKQLGKIVPTEKIQILPNMVPRTFLNTVAKQDSPPTDAPIRILFVGHLTIAKGFNCLLQAAMLMENRSRVVFNVLGQFRDHSSNIRFNSLTGEKLPFENSRELYDKLIVNGALGDCFKMHGDQIVGAEKETIFRSADIFVLPSYSESFSTAMLEAMASGACCVVTPVGAARDIIEDGENGFLMPVGDHQYLADLLDRLVVDVSVRQLVGLNARELVAKRYCDDVVIKSLIEKIHLYIEG